MREKRKELGQCIPLYRHTKKKNICVVREIEKKYGVQSIFGKEKKLSSIWFSSARILKFIDTFIHQNVNELFVKILFCRNWQPWKKIYIFYTKEKKNHLSISLIHTTTMWLYWMYLSTMCHVEEEKFIKFIAQKAILKAIMIHQKV